MDETNVPMLLITANVGSLFEDRENKEKIWVEKILETFEKFDPSFVALHFQECGGKVAAEAAFESVEDFTRALLKNEKICLRFDRRFAWIDQDFQKAEKFTALGCIYFIKKSLKNILVWNHQESQFVSTKVEEIKVGDLSDVSCVQKLKFPREFFPQLKWSRKGFMRTRWKINNCIFDLLNIHLFHDASNLEAMQMSPSDYSQARHRALKHILERLENDSLPKAPCILFGDFNFRLDTKAVVESLCAGLQSQYIRKDGESIPSKVLFRDKKISDKVVLAVETKKFVVHDQSYFHSEDGKRFQKYNREFEEFQNKLYEFNISFPPSYPFSDDIKEGMLYNNSRCPSWCDRVFLSHSARKMVIQDVDHSVTYDMIGRKVCMGDHKPVYLHFYLDSLREVLSVTQELK
ncbi:predicted protein [Nematostella vectensis]|uniref:inositol-polyphosphate 5-phosphatase n=1 Tax=Nematostella vectensis TaxID=45351 RepID=A7RGY0_NEMVE|nr:inositol polyphosphate-5-phosphatase A [Nematostella vectensis]EDO49130.1 predicted protein [Nematostella vectensis]|eukprot:XP_001641193.1 predicted protein [Nematostella vectensis]